MAKMTLDELRATNPSLSPKKEGHPPKNKQVLSHAGLPRADEPAMVNATAVEAPGHAVTDAVSAEKAVPPKRKK